MIKIRAIIEVLGKPKEFVEKVIKEMVGKIKEEKKILKYQVFEAEEKKDGVFSSFAEIELEFDNFDGLSLFCFQFMPSSIEILEPDKFNSDSKEIENFLNDILGRLHHNEMVVKKLGIENQQLKKQLDEKQ
ncbi:hypothetical protein K8R47_02295 [archaeon]|nr:hypothetical protein [archaeon]